MKRKNWKKITWIFLASLFVAAPVLLIGANVWMNYSYVWKHMRTCVVDGVAYKYMLWDLKNPRHADIGRSSLGIWFPGCAFRGALSSDLEPVVIDLGPAIDPSTSGALTIPASLDGYPVHSILPEAFAGCANLTSVTIPNGVGCVWNEAFKGCSGLESVTFLPSTNEEDSVFILDQAFAGCTNLTTITFPENVTRFWLCDGYGSIDGLIATLGSKTGSEASLVPGARVFGDTPFWKNQSDGVVIQNGCVLGVKGVCPENVVLPEGTRSIANGAFMASVPVSDESKNTANIYSGCTNLVSIMIPEGVTEIPRMAFVGCKRLTSVTLPSSLREIGDEAFAYCENLTSLAFQSGVEALEIGSGIFKGCSRLESLSFPTASGHVELSCRAVEDCVGLKSVTFLPSTNKEAVVCIDEYAFAGCTNLTTITFPENIKRLYVEEEYWSADCLIDRLPELMNAEAVASVLVPGANLFGDTPLWKNQADGVVIKDGWVLGVKGDCPENVVLPEGTRGLVVGAFRASLSVRREHKKDAERVNLYTACTNLASIVIPEGVRCIPELAFRGCEKLTSVTIPASVEEIGGEAFEGTALVENAATGVAICDGWIVGSNAKCPAKLDLPKGIRGIASGAFQERDELVSVTLPAGVTAIPWCVFEGCTNLQSVVIPDGAISIESCAFRNCSRLSRVTIPASVRDIDCIAFYKCVGLESVVFDGMPPRMAFYPGVIPDGAIGYYRPEHAAEWKKVLGKDGKWAGLKMEMVRELSK